MKSLVPGLSPSNLCVPLLPPSPSRGHPRAHLSAEPPTGSPAFFNCILPQKCPTSPGSAPQDDDTLCHSPHRLEEGHPSSKQKDSLDQKIMTFSHRLVHTALRWQQMSRGTDALAGWGQHRPHPQASGPAPHFISAACDPHDLVPPWHPSWSPGPQGQWGTGVITLPPQTWSPHASQSAKES